MHTFVGRTPSWWWEEEWVLLPPSDGEMEGTDVLYCLKSQNDLHSHKVNFEKIIYCFTPLMLG